MLFWGTLIIIVIGLIMVWYGEEEFEDGIKYTGSFLSIIFGIFFVLQIIFLIVQYSGQEGQLASLRDEYEALTFEIENMNIYDENGDISEDVFNHIKEWNQKIIFNYENEENFWIGIYIPNVYYEFDTIDYEVLLKTNKTSTQN